MRQTYEKRFEFDFWSRLGYKKHKKLKNSYANNINGRLGTGMASIQLQFLYV